MNQLSSIEQKIPTLEDLGYPSESSLRPSVFKGGETEGLKRMYKKISDEKYICEFEKPKTDPTWIEEPSTTGLSFFLLANRISFCIGKNEV